MKQFNRLSFFVAAFLLYSQATHAVFSDVSSHHPYFEAINYLQENEIVEGYEDGSYRPDQRVNRAEALKIILLGSDVLVPEIQEQAIFPDVVHGTWYAKFAAKGKNLGIVSGDSNTGMFRPGDTINLAEILKILLRTNNIDASEPTGNPYADVPMDAWFAPYFNYAFSISLLPQTSGENVEPATPVTRGLMAQLIYQLAMKPEGYQEGKATYYGSAFHGKGTASGEVFDASLFTAAHRTLPFGTWLKVQNLDNNKVTYVRVNDRGPYGDENRIVDLSKAAFESIASLSSGVINVSITPVSGPPGQAAAPSTSASCPSHPNLKRYAESSFENITLNSALPNLYLSGEVFFVSGSSAGSRSEVTVFLSQEGGTQIPFVTEIAQGGAFSVPVYFSEPGDYQMGILPGESGTSVVESVTILPQSCLSQSEDTSLSKPTHLQMALDGGDLVLSWTNAEGHDASRVTFIQGAKRKDYFLYNQTRLLPHYSDFEGWSEAEVQVEVRSGHLDGDSFAGVGTISWSAPLSGSFRAVTHHQYLVDPNKVQALSLPDTVVSGSSMTFKVDPKVNLDQWGRIILPSGQVTEVLLESPSHSPIPGTLGTQIFPASASDVRLKFTPASADLHFIEINDEQGIAGVNIPLYPPATYPLLPNPVDLSDLLSSTLSGSLSALQSQMLQLVNADRAAHGLAAVRLDSNLNQLAQSRSDDMAARDYFGHWNPDGMTANDLRKDFAIAQYVSENIARDASLPLAEYGLMRSASHRSNILNSEWQRVGFGFTQDDTNGILFTQIFSDDPINFSDVPALRNELVSALNKNRALAITQSDTLSVLSQSWADKWVAESWCDINQDSCNPLTAPDGTFTETVRDGGIAETLGAYYRGDSSFESAKEAIAENAGLQDGRWKKVGIGIKQDSFGIIHLFVTYTE